MIDLRRKIMGNRINGRVFSLGQEVYVVGGYLRDIMLGRKSNDIDYIVKGNVKEFVMQLLMHKSGDVELRKLLDRASIVELKGEQVIRIVLEDGTILDFTELKGEVEKNLGERDFTINAMAWSSQTGIIDPFGGIRDIRKKVIRAVSEENLRNDPLRLLRVYRFVSELGWDADIKTRKIVRTLKREIKRSAAERITLEFFRLLNSAGYYKALRMAFVDGLLESFLSVPYKRLSENIKTMSVLEARIRKMPQGYRSALENHFSQELTIKGLLRLEHLLYGAVLSRSRLRLSRAILKRLEAVHSLLSESKRQNLFLKNRIFDAFVIAEDAVFDFLVLSGNIKFLKEAERFKKIWRKSFLTAKEIMAITKLEEGVKLGRLILGLKKMQFEGRLKTKKEAIEWLGLNYSGE